MPAMTSPYHPSALRASRAGRAPLAAGQRVTTPSGVSGRIVGFYQTRTPTALVNLDGGGSCQFYLHELQP